MEKMGWAGRNAKRHDIILAILEFTDCLDGISKLEKELSEN